MRLNQTYWLTEADRRSFESIQIFINRRLDDRKIFEWALKLDSRHQIERLAIQAELEHRGDGLTFPRLEAWRLLMESWDTGDLPDQASVDEIHIRRRLAAGDRSGDMVRRIIDLVKPVLVVKPVNTDSLPSRRRKRAPKAVSDLISIDTTSAHPVNPVELGIQEIVDEKFLTELADELDFVISKTFALADRIGYSSAEWRIGVPRRVSYVPQSELSGDEHEPDEFATGIAAATKLLCAVVERIWRINELAARRFIARWKVSRDLLRTRLWCVMARDESRASADEVYEVLTETSQRQFWSLDGSPEVSEVRAVRFSDMSIDQQMSLIARIRKGPPATFWSKGSDPERVKSARLYRALKEVKRIDVCGGVIPKKHEKWFREGLLQFPEIASMTEVSDDFWTFKKARWIPPNPDRKFDELSGRARLIALEEALSDESSGWHDDPAERASDWIRSGGNAQRLLADFDTLENQSQTFPLVWDRFAWSHRPSSDSADKQRDASDADRVLRLISNLPKEVCSQAIEGITSWLDTWGEVVRESLMFRPLWMKLWPIAVAKTNSETSEDLDPLNTNVRGGTDQDPRDLDTINTAAGKLVGLFLNSCPKFSLGENPFAEDLQLRAMRDACLSMGGRSELIARYRLIQDRMEYLCAADAAWANKALLSPLLDDTHESLVLWRALAWRRRFSNIVSKLGTAMIARVSDERLGRETRSTLAVSIALEVLHSFNEGRPSEVAINDVTQMLRSATDDVRVEVAKLLEQFVSNMSSPNDNGVVRRSAEELFRDSIRPFLESVWPQEFGLSTPGIARGLSDLPASCKGEFANAVQAIHRFLVPFESWSLYDYGLRDRNHADSLDVVDTPHKASGLLDLLDATISGADRVAYPMELGTALERISLLAPSLSNMPAFRRLAALARR